jgi:hypothetical protein
MNNWENTIYANITTYIWRNNVNQRHNIDLVARLNTPGRRRIGDAEL